MQYRVIKQTLLAFSLALPFAASPSRAAVSVTQVSGSGSGAPYDISYILNTTATSGSLEIVNSSNAVVRTIALAGGDLSRGSHIVQWDGKATGGSNAPAGQYTARVNASAAAVPAGGKILWGPQLIGGAAQVPVYAGVAVNRNVGSPYYGRIYLADYSNDQVKGYTADGTKVLEVHYGVFGAGVRSLAVGQDDRIYVLVQQDSGPNPIAGFFSMKQDGTDFRGARNAPEIVVGDGGSGNVNLPKECFVTGTGDDRRFYWVDNDAVRYTTPAISAASLPPVVVIDNDTDPITSWQFEGLAVLDKNNDPAGHSGKVTIFLRTTSNGSAAPNTIGSSTLSRWDSDKADPTDPNGVTWTKVWDAKSVFPGEGFTGGTVDLGPGDTVWTPLSSADTSLRGFLQIKQSDGTLVQRINPVPEKPRLLAVDVAGNVVGLTLPDAVTGNRPRNIGLYAPADSGSTFTGVSAPFAVSAVVLTPIKITAGPAVDAASTSATITWTTDVASTTEVSYGLSAEALSNNVSDATLTKNHSITITGLTKNTPYFYSVRSTAEGFASVQTSAASFSTKDVLGEAINPTATTTTNSATITWTTAQPTSSVVRYGTSPDALTQTATGTVNATAHTVNIGGLNPGTTYYYVAQSGSAVYETTSSSVTFFATLTPEGTRVRTLSGLGTLKFGLMDEVQITGAGITLNKKGLPNGVDDAAVPDLPQARHSLGVVAYGGYLYAIGGRGAVAMPTVYMAKINADGTVGAWSETTALPDNLYMMNNGAFGYNGAIYVVGGANLPATSTTAVFQSVTLMAKQNPVDGTLGPWTQAGVFPGDPAPTRAHGSVNVYNGKAYYVGGNDTAAYTDVFIADIRPDGTLDWVHDDSGESILPVVTTLQGSAAHNGILYLWGGSDGTFPSASIYTSQLSADGKLSMWNPTGGMDNVRAAMASGLINGYGISVGGSDALANYAAIAAGEVAADGTIPLQSATTVLYQAPGTPDPQPLRDLDGAAWQGRFYVAGGRTSATGMNPTLDSTGNAYAAAITFVDSGSYVSNGHYESTIMDLGKEEALNTLAVTATGSGVTVSTRTAGPDGKFGPWTKHTGLSVTFAAGAKARYLQFALDLSGGATAPVVSSVALNYGTPGVIPGGDARKALEIVGGLRTATQADITAMDKNGDGKITIEDVVALARS